MLEQYVFGRCRMFRGKMWTKRSKKARADCDLTMSTLQQVSDELAGRSRAGASSLNKLFWSELDIRLHELALDILGPEAELESAWSKGFQFSLSGPIYAGTNEIQRNIVAERLLGLPRA